MAKNILDKKEHFLKKGWREEEFSRVERIIRASSYGRDSHDILTFLIYVILALVLMVVGAIVILFLFILLFSKASSLFYFSLLFFGWLLGVFLVYFIDLHVEFEKAHKHFLLIFNLLLPFLAMYGLKILLVFVSGAGPITASLEEFDVMIFGAIYAISFSVPYAMHLWFEIRESKSKVVDNKILNKKELGKKELKKKILVKSNNKKSKVNKKKSKVKDNKKRKKK